MSECADLLRTFILHTDLKSVFNEGTHNFFFANTKMVKNDVSVKLLDWVRFSLATIIKALTKDFFPNSSFFT